MLKSHDKKASSTEGGRAKKGEGLELGPFSLKYQQICWFGFCRDLFTTFGTKRKAKLVVNIYQTSVS